MMIKYLIAVVLVLCVFCIPAQAVDLMPETGTASCFLVKGGALKAAVTVSWEVLTVEEYTFYLDGLMASGDIGIGLSTDVKPIADNILNLDKWLYPTIPIGPLVDRLAVGTVIFHDDNVIKDGGVYLRLSLKEWKF